MLLQGSAGGLMHVFNHATYNNDAVDIDGCQIGDSPGGPIVVNICGSAGPMSIMLMFVGFAALRFVTARRL